MRNWLWLAVAVSVLTLPSPTMPQCFLQCPLGDEEITNVDFDGTRTVDFSADGLVGLADLAMFAFDYPNAGNPDPPFDPCSDLNCDGIINLVDLAIFATHYTDAGDVANECVL